MGERERRKMSKMRTGNQKKNGEKERRKNEKNEKMKREEEIQKRQ